MNDVRKRIEKGFAELALLIYAKKWLFLLLMIVIIAALLSRLPNLKIK